MTCEQYQELISADLDAELRADEEPALWEHLAHCTVCRAWRRDQLAMRYEFERWPEETYPAITDGPVKRSRPATKVYRVPRVLAWAAAIVLLVQGALVTSSLMHTPDMRPDLAATDEETVETIVLTAKDEVVRFSTTENPLIIGKPLTHPDENGG